MERSLVETIRHIEASSEYSTIEDRDRAIRSAFEYLARTNSAARARMKGIPFLVQYEELRTKYDSDERYKSPVSTPQALDALKKETSFLANDVSHFAECALSVEDYNRYRSTKIKTGVAIGGIFGLAGVLLTAYLNYRWPVKIGDTISNDPIQMSLFEEIDHTQAVKNHIGSSGMNRRQFMENALMGLGAIGLGSALGGAIMEVNAKEVGGLDVTYQNIKYLDEVYQRVFPNKNTLREPKHLDRRSFFNTLRDRV